MAIPIVETYLELVRRLNPGYLKEMLEKEEASFSVGLMRLLLTVFFLAVVAIINTGVLTLILKPESVFSPASKTIIFTPFAIIITTIIFISVMFLFARLLGGSGSFESHFYHFSNLACALLMIVALLSLIPIVGYFGVLLVVLYSAYPTFTIYSRMHKVGRIRAAILAGVPILGAVIIISFLILLMIFITTIGGSYHS